MSRFKSHHVHEEDRHNSITMTSFAFKRFFFGKHVLLSIHFSIIFEPRLEYILATHLKIK